MASSTSRRTRSTGGQRLAKRTHRFFSGAAAFFSGSSRRILIAALAVVIAIVAVSAGVARAARIRRDYTRGVEILVDGVVVGVVEETTAFEDMVARVEQNAAEILGYDYRLDRDISYRSGRVLKTDLAEPSPDLESELFRSIDEIIDIYTLVVDGEEVGSVRDQSVLTDLLKEIKAPYLTVEADPDGKFLSQRTISVELVVRSVDGEGLETYIPAPISIEPGYATTSFIDSDTDAMRAVLTANTDEEVIYTVQAGDAAARIARSYEMSLSELQALNPQIEDLAKIWVGDKLTVRAAVPFLAVKTVDAVVFEETVESPVEEVPDDTMYKGETSVKFQGEDGVEEITADIVYINGREQSRAISNTVVTKEPTTTIVKVGTKARPKTMPTGSLKWPLSGTITSNYGYRKIFGSTSFHSGIDIATKEGTSIKAADGGTVTFSGKGTGSSWSYGKYVVIDHGNGLQTIYAHCSSLLVSAGDKVYQGQVIARVGHTGRATGPHLHFQVKKNGTTVSPWNYLK